MVGIATLPSGLFEIARPIIEGILNDAYGLTVSFWSAAGHCVHIDDPALTWSGIEKLVYAKDAANPTVLACYADHPISRIYNITMGRAYTFDELLKIVRRRFPSVKIEVSKINPGATGGYRYKREQPTDISRARSELGYKPEFDTIEKAIEDYAEWIRVNGF